MYIGIGDLDDFGSLPAPNSNLKIAPREKENTRPKKSSSEKTANRLIM